MKSTVTYTIRLHICLEKSLRCFNLPIKICSYITKNKFTITSSNEHELILTIISNNFE